MASRAAFRGDDQDHWAYAASKGGMVSLTKTLARAFAAKGILAYGIAPGFVVTDMVQAEFDEDPGLAARVLRDVPMGDFAPAEQMRMRSVFSRLAWRRTQRARRSISTGRLTSVRIRMRGLSSIPLICQLPPWIVN